MTLREKALYHQIHPLKLATDIGTAVWALALLRRRRLGSAVIVATVPPLLASITIMWKADLEHYKRSALGTYLNRHMTPTAQLLRLGGFAVMALGAWYRRRWLLLVGLLLILAAWFRGLIIIPPASTNRRVT